MLMDTCAMFSFSYPNGEPQTPTRTPTSAAFVDPAFQTPKIESSFYDPRVTWDTADPYASSPEFLKTPQRFVFGTPSNNLHPVDGAYGQHLSPHTNLRGGADETDTAKRRRPSQHHPGFGEDGPGTVNSAKCSAASIQTPPPTSTSRRKVADFNNAGTGGQAYMESARKLSAATDTTHLETPSRLIGASPHMFTNFPNSPDLFQLASVGPSASPFFPQQKLFWQQDVDQQTTSIGPNAAHDPFAAGTSSAFTAASMGSRTLGVPPLPIVHGAMDLPEFSGEVNFGIGTTAPADAALFPAPFSTSPRVPITKAEDPNLFLSSPARRFGPPQPISERQIAPREQPRQPYHHQTEESKREQLHLASQNRNRPLSASFSDEEEDEDDCTPRARGMRPGLTRSLTHTAVTSLSLHARQQTQPSLAGTLASTSGIKKPPSRGRSSPIKSMRQPRIRANSASLPSRSQSLILKIDKDGRAKTEIQHGNRVPTGLTDPIAEMDIDGSVTESESDSAEFSDYPIAHSTNTSFAFPGPALTQPKVSRTGSISRPNSKSSYSSTAASSNSGRRSPWVESSRVGSRRPQSAIIPSDWANTPRRYSIPANADLTRGTSSSALTDSTLPEPEEDSGDAQHALRKVLKGRTRNSGPSVGGYGSGRVPVSQSLSQLHSSPPGMGHRYDDSTSPTTITDPDLATPNTDRLSNPSNGTRCVCKSMDNGGHLMIQWWVQSVLDTNDMC